MDVEKRFELIKGIGDEIITEEELRQLLETNTHPVAYDGFEPSGLAHLPFGVFRPLLLKDMLKAGVRFKLYLADWFAWINNKMDGDLEKIKKVGEYFVEVWRAAGVDLDKVEIVWSSAFAADREYWKRVLLIAKSTSVSRATRCLTIMGRKAGELTETAQYFYPMMQTADVFHLDVDITQLGLDQRRANVLAREIAPKFGWKKPVVVSHHMLMGLQGVKEPEGYDVTAERDVEISSKMSKSKPQTCIYVHDSKDDIKRKIGGAFCEAKNTINNPVLDYSKHIVFRAFKSMNVERAEKFGGPLEFGSYQELEQAFLKGELHPLDLKNAAADYLDKLISPVREHFEKNKKAHELYEFVKAQEITR
jgi:tyrosyl-tRNA synthetase